MSRKVSKFLGKKKIGSYSGILCKVDGCNTQARKSGMCTKHYAAVRQQNPEWRAERQAKRLEENEKKMGRPRPDFCEICNGPPNDHWGVLHFDHDHVTGKPRGWTCRNCNVILGLAKDSVDRLLDLAEYLEKHNANR
jgi:Recombination endonuclease VII